MKFRQSNDRNCILELLISTGTIVETPFSHDPLDVRKNWLRVFPEGCVRSYDAVVFAFDEHDRFVKILRWDDAAKSPAR